MKIALCQMRVIPGAMKRNVENMQRFIDKAINENADVAVFPEMCVTGYLVGDKWNDDAFIAEAERFSNKLADFIDGRITVIYGNVENLSATPLTYGQDGRPTKINAAIMTDGKTRYINAKQLLPNYREFDDKRYFSVPFESDITPLDDKKIGTTICEDLWCGDYYPRNPALELQKKGANFITNSSSSPFSVNKDKARDKAIKALGISVPFFYVNCVGAQNNGKNVVLFDGDTRAYDKSGKKVPVALPPFMEGIIYATIDEDDEIVNATAVITEKNTNRQDKLFAKRSPIEQKIDAILESFRYVNESTGGNGFVIGISGGIDSAVSAWFAKKAVGKDLVHAVTLPTKYNSELTKNAAELLCYKLDLDLQTVFLEDMVEGFHKGMGSYISGIHAENIQSRLRGMVLQTLAGLYNGATVICNANKVEMFAGYTTYLGDDIGAFAPLADLTKEEIWDIARWINAQSEDGIIPNALIPEGNYYHTSKFVAPSAELAGGQVDPFWWGIDDAIVDHIMRYRSIPLEQMMLWFLDDPAVFADNLGIDRRLILEWTGEIGIGNETRWKVFAKHMGWLARANDRAVFKRAQAPMVVITTSQAYGFDYRESQFMGLTEEFRRLEAVLLAPENGRRELAFAEFNYKPETNQ
jgi:NAD+ synthase (glutamine-hydrolysing)